MIEMLYAMKNLILVFILACLVSPFSMVLAQTNPTSPQIVENILTVAEHRDELVSLNANISTVLADSRLTDQATRQMLQSSQGIIAEMLNQKIGTNSAQLVDLAKWMGLQGAEKRSIQDAEEAPTPQQQFVLDNPLAGREVYLTSLLKGILTTYLEIDREAAGATKLEGLLQLYLEFRPTIERSWWLADGFLLYAPLWTQSRYPQLTAEQKQQFLKDVNDARAEKVLGPAADEEPMPTPTAQEQAAYDAAYQFIVSNTPQP